MRSSPVHLTAVRIGIAQYVSRKLYHHHLHAQADTEGGDVVLTTIACCAYLTLDTTLSKARADKYAGAVLQEFGSIAVGELLAVHES